MASSKTSMRTTNKNTLLKVVILGDGGVGKSCLMNRFVSNQFDEHSFHTIGVEFLNKDVEIDGETYTLQVGYYLLYLSNITNCFNKVQVVTQRLWFHDFFPELYRRKNSASQGLQENTVFSDI